MTFSLGAQSPEESVETCRIEAVLVATDGTSSDKVVSYPSVIFITSNILIQQPHFLCVLEASYFCCICHAHFNDKRKNSMKNGASGVSVVHVSCGHTWHVVLKRTCIHCQH